MDYQRLLDTTEQILILRGSSTSGNWAHAGRKGKKGGSGRGGGFGRIGVKSGKAGRGKIKQASRQTRGRDERAKGGGLPKTSGAIPAGPVGRARGVVDKARGKRDKELKTGRKANTEIEKSKASATKAQQTFFNSSDKVQPAFEKSQKARDKANKKTDEIFAILNSEQSTSDPKVSAKIDKLQGQSSVLEKKANKANEQFQAISKQNDINRQKDTEATRNHNATLDKHKDVKKPKDITKSFQEETDQASRVLFQHNLNESKRVRGAIKKESERTNVLQKEIDLNEERADKAFVKNDEFAKKFGANDPRTKKPLEEAFEISEKIDKQRRELRAKKKQEIESVRQLLEVDNPTTIRQAPGSQKDRVSNPNLENRRKQGQAGFQNLVSDDVVPKGSLVKYQNTDDGRSFQVNGTTSEVHMASFSGPDVVVHELGHTAENYNPRLLRRSIEFRDKRTTGEDYQPLSDLTGNPGYDSNEKAKPDKFINPYMGKDYGATATEIFSMGIEEMYRDPVGFAEKDPEMFDFIYAQARTP